MMGKLDDLKRSGSAVALESMGIYTRNRTPETFHQEYDPKTAGVKRFKNAVEIDLGRIDRDPTQPREEFETEALSRLAESLKSRGQLQPIQVRWDEGRGVYAIVVGERRWRAAQLAGLASLQCVVRDGPISPGDLLAIQVIENALREDLRPIEQAKAYRTLMELNSWSASQLARELAIGQPNVARALALLSLPSPVQDQVDRGEVTPSAAYEISKLNSPEQQVEVAERVVVEGLKYSDVTRVVKKAKPKGRAVKPSKVTEKRFRTEFGPRVVVEFKRGLDHDSIRTALIQALAQLEEESQTVAA